MKFGGNSQFGSMQFGGDPYGHDPNYVCNRIISALSVFLKTETAGCIKTIKRLAGDFGNQAAMDRLLTEGAPAFLVLYEGGAFVPATSSNCVFVQAVKYSVFCVAGSYQDQTERLAGRNVYEPGLDNMLRWATYYVMRELIQVESLNMVKPIAHQYLKWLPGKYVGVASFEATTRMDIYDDEPTMILERLGIVHNPIDLSELFLVDNTTPNTNDPTGLGVATL